MMSSKKKSLIAVLVIAVAFFGIFGYAMTDYHGENDEVEEIQSLQQEVFEVRDELIADGVYNCCLENPCTQCFINMPDGRCPCGPNLIEGGPVCHECKGGWFAGDGAIEGIDPEEVEPMPRGEEE